ncbi:MAG: efflux transporter outer membrane subunit [Verrucomicrobiia bacterium]
MTLSGKSRATWLTALAVSALLAGCAVGPDFKKPAAPSVSGYTPTPLTTTSSSTNIVGGEAQRFVSGQDISGEWWTLFHSKPLNALIERSLTNNPNIKAGQAALTMARETMLSQKGAYYPSASGSFSTARQRTSTKLSPVPSYTTFNFNLFTPEVSVSYVPDVFGLNRRTVESLNAQTEQARYALAATHITLSANVVAAAIQEASLRAQIAATHDLITINTNMLQILRDQFAKGYASRLAVAAQESQLAQVTATLPPLLEQLGQQHDLMAALCGDFPSQNTNEEFELSSLQLPQELPVSLPSKLVEQRPDVRQAEENLHAASAQVGIAIANRLPSFPLTANLGSAALEAGEIFAGGAGFWTLAGSVTQPIFEGGTLLHRERAARAAYLQAAEQYRSTVITAFQNVADTLTALEHDADTLNAATASKDAAKISLDLSQQQWQSGHVGYLALLSAEQAYSQALITLVQAQSNRYADTAALFQALGGGWWNCGELTKK